MENSTSQTLSAYTTEALGGIGLVNVRKRLELIYQDRYELNIINEETYLVSLKIKISDNELPDN